MCTVNSSCPTLYRESITPGQFLGWLGEHRDSRFCNKYIPFYILSRPENRREWLAITGITLRQTVQENDKTGNFFTTDTLTIASSQLPELLYAFLRDITRNSPTGFQHVAVPACILTRVMMEITPNTRYGGYGNRSLITNAHINLISTQQIHSADLKRLSPHLPQLQAQDDDRSQEDDQHNQVTAPTNSRLFPQYVNHLFRTLFGERPPRVARTWAELMPGPHGHDDFPLDLKTNCDGWSIHLILLTGPNKDRDVDPVKLIWSLPKAPEVLEIFFAAVLNLHGGDIDRATETLSTLVKHSDFSTGSSWITPNDWVTFDFFRIFIRATTKDGRRFETFPAHGITTTAPPPATSGLYRYATYNPLYTHMQLLLSPQQANSPKVCGNDGPRSRQSYHTGVFLCGLGLRLSADTDNLLAKSRNVFIAYFTLSILFSDKLYPNQREPTPTDCFPHLESTYKPFYLLAVTYRLHFLFSVLFSVFRVTQHKGTSITSYRATYKNFNPHPLVSRSFLLANPACSQKPNEQRRNTRMSKPPATRSRIITIYNPEEGTPKPPRAEKMASTNTRHYKVNFLNLPKNKMWSPPNCALLPKGPHFNIFNREEGMPKPPRVKKMASTTTPHPRVRHSHITYNAIKKIQNIFINNDFSPTGLSNNQVRDTNNSKLPMTWEDATKVQIHLKPRVRKMTREKPQLAAVTTYITKAGAKAKHQHDNKGRLGHKKRGATKINHTKTPSGKPNSLYIPSASCHA